MYALGVFITVLMIVTIAQAELAGRGRCCGWWQVHQGSENYSWTIGASWQGFV